MWRIWDIWSSIKDFPWRLCLWKGEDSIYAIKEMCIYIKGYLYQFMFSMIDISVKLVGMSYMFINYSLSDKKWYFYWVLKNNPVGRSIFTPRVSIDMVPSIYSSPYLINIPSLASDKNNSNFVLCSKWNNYSNLINTIILIESFRFYYNIIWLGQVP